MNIGKARALFNQIAAGDLKNYTVGEYLEAVKEVSNMVTFNSITKDQFVKVFRWLVMVAERVVSPYRWIPCGERLPEEGERVLATHLGGINPNKQVIEHIYQCGKFTYGWDMDMDVDSPTFGQRYMGEVIAWMPLPEPYREDDAK